MNVLRTLTQNYLKRNRKRTIVTIIGIILSAAMITAVATLIVSAQGFMVEVEKELRGSYEAIFNGVSNENIKYMVQNDKFKEIGLSTVIGSALNDYSKQPYIRIDAYDENSFQNRAIELKEGRLPQNSSEIILSERLLEGEEKKPQIGQTIRLKVGHRMENGKAVDNEDDRPNESFVIEGEKEYTICGFMKQPKYEGGMTSSAGIIGLDQEIINQTDYFNVMVIMKNPKKIYEDCTQVAEAIQLPKQNDEYDITYNEWVLMYMGISDKDSFNKVLYRVGIILMVLIMVGSIIVIYNSFAISVSERKKQFGMLSSVGATKKQIRKSVLYEGAILGGIGIPLGILSGIGGIEITLKIVNTLIAGTLNVGDVDLKLIISWPAILVSIILIGITIYLSAIIPARRAGKITPIEAIRQSDDIKVKPKKLKTPKWIRKIFGIEGEIALKNLKRSKKRYRTTVLSLIISIVLFITVSGFIQYMFKGVESMYLTTNYDIAINFLSNDSAKENEELIKQIRQIKEADMVSFQENVTGMAKIPEDKLGRSIKENEIMNRYAQESKMEDNYYVNTSVVYMMDEEYQNYLKLIGASELKENEAILVNRANIIEPIRIEADITEYKQGDTITVTDYSKEQATETNYQITKITDKLPIGTFNAAGNLVLVVSEKGIQQLAEKNAGKMLYIKTQDASGVQKQLDQLIAENNRKNQINIINMAELMENNEKLKNIFQIFLYGFICLISLIGIANIFNTISTNIALRRREFANLKSIGMTNKSFKKMLDLECVFYGTKSLLYGVPIGIVLCYFLNKAFAESIVLIFKIPWSSILIAAFAVYSIVFITMIYATRKVKKENIIDIIRDDNI